MKLVDEAKVAKCLTDLEKILQADQLMISLEHMKDDSNIERYLDYILSNRVITSLEEIFAIVRQRPEISKQMANCLRKNKNRGKIVDLKPEIINNSTISPYAGRYASLKDVPGYGTAWNERCIPDGVYIDHSGDNKRC